MRKFLITMMCIVMVVCFMPTVAMAETQSPCSMGDGCTHVAAIGTTHYDTLQAAIDAATDNQTVRLLTSIKSGVKVEKSISIDLNNKTLERDTGQALWVAGGNVSVIGTGTISSDNTIDGGYAVVVGYGSTGATLTIGKDVTVSGSAEYGVFAAGSENAPANLIVNGNVTTTGEGAAISGNGDRSPANITINDGATVSCTKGAGIYFPQAGTLTVNGGTITGKHGIQMCSGTLNISGNPIITATGTDETATKEKDGPIPDGAAVSVVNRSYPGGVPSATISGTPTIKSATGQQAFRVYIWDAANKKATSWADANVSIIGGIFSSDVSAYVPEGTKVVDNGNGEYILAPNTNAVAQVGGAGYTSLQAAINAATNGQTVTLLGDVKLGATITIDKNITIDLNTHTISSNEVGSAIFQNDGQISLLMKNGSIINNSDGKVFYWVADGELTLANVRVTAEEARAIQIEDNAEVIIDKDSIVTGNDYSIYMRSYNETQKPTLHVYGKVSCINSEAIATKGSTPVINIYEGANIISDAWTAIYFQNPVVLNISGGTLRGGNEMTIIGEDVYTDDEDNEIYYPIGLHENSSISGGYFYGGILLSENTKQFISGGRFSHSYLIPEFAVKDRYVSKESIANDAMYLVHEHSTCNFGHTYCPATCKDENGVEMCHTLSHYVAPPTTPTTPTDNVTNSGTAGTDNATTSADLSGSTSTSNGTTSATVDKTTADKIVDKAVENKSTEVVIDATANSSTAANSTTTAQVTIPTDTLGAIAEKTEADVTIKTDVAEVKLDNASAAAVAEQAQGDTVQIIAEKVAEETDKVEFELKVVCSNGKVISDFKGGNVAVTVALPKAMADKKLVCVYIDDNGHMSKMEGQKNADGTYTFNTGHFSSYAIMAEEEADAAIAAQKEAIKNIKIKLTSKQVKTKAGKKAVKITWTAAAGDKVLDGVEVYRSTERYKGYGTEPFYTSTKGGNTGSYTNTKSLKKGTKYYYRVRGYILVNGEKVYTDYSTKAWRTVK